MNNGFTDWATDTVSLLRKTEEEMSLFITRLMTWLEIGTVSGGIELERDSLIQQNLRLI